ncbi:ubiquitin-specific protease doa4 [Dispira parvispora]|uniref:ubiquitinyl hydrolase 1 n=1 Tax=Dispira parvispora TaxID=1520584 RepID=A0A9W8B0C7_9FUNG|nr:ubiquitin-specific protease doa4 [Dispira parvispora]
MPNLPTAKPYQVHPTLARLNQKAKVPPHKNYSVRTWIHSAFKLYDQGQIARIENQTHDAYVTLMKCCSIAVEIISKHKDFSLVQRDPSYLDLRKKVTDIMPVLEALAKTIEESEPLPDAETSPDSASTENGRSSDFPVDASALESEGSNLASIPRGNTSARIQQFMQRAQQQKDSGKSGRSTEIGLPRSAVPKRPVGKPVTVNPPSAGPRPKPNPLPLSSSPMTSSEPLPKSGETSMSPLTSPSTPRSTPSSGGSSSLYFDAKDKGLFAEILRARAQSAVTKPSSSTNSSAPGSRDQLVPNVPHPQPTSPTPISDRLNSNPKRMGILIPQEPSPEQPQHLPSPRNTMSDSQVNELAAFRDPKDILLPPSPPPDMVLPSFEYPHSSPMLTNALDDPIRHTAPRSTTTLKFPLTTTITAENLATYFTITPPNDRPTVLLLDIRAPDVRSRGRIGHQHTVPLDPSWLMSSTITAQDVEEQLRRSGQREALDWFRQRHWFDIIVYFDEESTALVDLSLRTQSTGLPPALIPAPNGTAQPSVNPTTTPSASATVNPLQLVFEVIYERAFTCIPKRMPLLLVGGFSGWKQWIRHHPRLPQNLVDPPVTPVLPPATSDNNGSTGIHRNIYDYLNKRVDGPIAAPQNSRGSNSTPSEGQPRPPAYQELRNNQRTNPHVPHVYAKQPSSYSHSTIANSLSNSSMGSTPGLSTNNTPHMDPSASVPPLTVNTTPVEPSINGGSQMYSSDLPSAVLSRMYGLPSPVDKPGVPQLPSDVPKNPPSNGSSDKLVRRRSVFDNPYYGFTHIPVSPTKGRDQTGKSGGTSSSPKPYPKLTGTSQPTPTLPQVKETSSTKLNQSTPLQTKPMSVTPTSQVSHPAGFSVPALPTKPADLRSNGPTEVTYAPTAAPLLKPPLTDGVPLTKSNSTPASGWKPSALPPAMPTPPLASDNHPPPTAPKPALSNQLVNIGTTGLRNFGNTCFMNSIVQCLSATVPLARFFMDGSYKRHLNRMNPMGSKGVLTESFAVLIRTMWSGQYSVVSPVGFREAVGRFGSQFKGDDQQDSQEFLGFLLDGLHEDLNLASKPGSKPSHQVDTIPDSEWEKLPEQRASDLAWEHYLLKNASVVVGLFQGQLQSRLRCLTCQATSTTYTPFMSLSIPIPVSGPGRQSQSSVRLHQCLDAFVHQEVLEGEDQWHCPQCKTRRRATKQMYITRLPDILLIHLKRFSFQGPFRDKLESNVAFPLCNLDMSPYLAPAFRPGSSQLPTAKDQRAACVYDLYAVSNHFGGLNGGHYTATVRSGFREKWFLFDDSRVFECDEGKVVSQAAYNLFYVRSNVC